MRGPWDAFAEKRTSNRVYFCTGMGGCLQSVLYGFAGLQVVEPGQKGQGTKIAGDGEASLYADPHLPPGWGGLTVKGVRFRGKTFDLTVTPGNKVTVDAADDALAATPEAPCPGCGTSPQPAPAAAAGPAGGAFSSPAARRATWGSSITASWTRCS